MSRRRFTAGLVSVLLLALAVAVATAPSAHACSCAGADDAASLERADAVFVGRLNDIHRPISPLGRSSADASTFHFDVDRVFKGDVSKSQAIVTASSGASCGLELTDGQVAMVFASRRGSPFVTPGPDQLYAGLCSGTRVVVGDAPPAGFPAARAPAVQSSPPGRAAPVALFALVVVAGAAGAGVAALVWKRRLRGGEEPAGLDE